LASSQIFSLGPVCDSIIFLSEIISLIQKLISSPGLISLLLNLVKVSSSTSDNGIRPVRHSLNSANIPNLVVPVTNPVR